MALCWHGQCVWHCIAVARGGAPNESSLPASEGADDGDTVVVVFVDRGFQVRWPVCPDPSVQHAGAGLVVDADGAAAAAGGEDTDVALAGVDVEGGQVGAEVFEDE